MAAPPALANGDMPARLPVPAPTTDQNRPLTPSRTVVPKVSFLEPCGEVPSKYARRSGSSFQLGRWVP
jgi:hypothetical protein